MFALYFCYVVKWRFFFAKKDMISCFAGKMYLHSVAQRSGVSAPQLYNSQVSFRQYLKVTALKC